MGKKGISKYPPLDPNIIVICQCGCEEQIPFRTAWIYTGIPKFKHGHLSKHRNENISVFKHCERCGKDKLEFEFYKESEPNNNYTWCRACWYEWKREDKQTRLKYYPNLHCICKDNCNAKILIRWDHRCQGIPLYAPRHKHQDSKFLDIDLNAIVYCDCHCGQTIKMLPKYKWTGIPKYIHGHNGKGKSNPLYNRKHAEETLEILRKARLGKTHTDRVKEIDSRTSKERWQDPEYRRSTCLAISVSRMGMKFTEEHCRNISLAQGGNGTGTFCGYPKDFREQRKIIRDRDNHICVICKLDEDQIGHTLSVHHIDYNKKNCDPMNLISTCKSCHSKTRFNRTYWETVLQQLMQNKYAEVTQNVS